MERTRKACHDVILVEHGVQIAGRFRFLDLFLQIAKVDQVLHAVAKLLGRLFRLLVRCIAAGHTGTLVFDDFLYILQLGQGDVLKLWRQYVGQHLIL